MKVYFINTSAPRYATLLIIMIIIPCSGMFRNVPCSGFYRRPIFTDTMILPSKTRTDDSTITVTSPANTPRGLVVWIRRSHRRGPALMPFVGIYFLLLAFIFDSAGSIPGVGIFFLLLSFSIRNYTVIATFETTETIQRDRQSFVTFLGYEKHCLFHGHIDSTIKIRTR